MKEERDYTGHFELGYVKEEESVVPVVPVPVHHENYNTDLEFVQQGIHSINVYNHEYDYHTSHAVFKKFPSIRASPEFQTFYPDTTGASLRAPTSVYLNEQLSTKPYEGHVLQHPSTWGSSELYNENNVNAKDGTRLVDIKDKPPPERKNVETIIKKGKEAEAKNGEDIKPEYSYVALIVKAIENSPQRKLQLADIYKYVMEEFPYYRLREERKEHGWKNSIRHNLSLNDCFCKIPKDPGSGGGKGNYWTLIVSSAELFEKGNMKRRKKSARKRTLLPYDIGASHHLYSGVKGCWEGQLQANAHQAAAAAAYHQVNPHTLPPAYHHHTPREQLYPNVSLYYPPLGSSTFGTSHQFGSYSVAQPTQSTGDSPPNLPPSYFGAAPPSPPQSASLGAETPVSPFSMTSSGSTFGSGLTTGHSVFHPNFGTSGSPYTHASLSPSHIHSGSYTNVDNSRV